MCHARAAILRLRSGPFSVDTLVHAEQFLGLDGERSITAPVAVCDSPHGRPDRRCGQTSNVCSGSKAVLGASLSDLRFTPDEQTSASASIRSEKFQKRTSIPLLLDHLDGKAAWPRTYFSVEP